jgi:DNA-binding IclR family transcriptional regulator
MARDLADWATDVTTSRRFPETAVSRHETLMSVVIERTFSIIEVMARLAAPVSLAALTDECRLPKPTIYRILQTLRALGYVEPAAVRGSYVLSERLASLSQNDRYRGAREKALPLMRRLHRTFNETVNLALLESVYVNYLHILETTQPLRWIVKPGARDPFHTTALGRAIVARFPEARQQILLRKAMPRTHILRLRMQAELATTVSRGWAVDYQESAAGVVCVALSLEEWGEPCAALSVSVPAQRFNPALLNRIVAAFDALPRPHAPARAVGSR